MKTILKITTLVPESLDITQLNVKQLLFLTKLSSLIQYNDITLEEELKEVNKCNRFNPLSSKVIASLLGGTNSYKKVLDSLKSLKIIESNESYSNAEDAAFTKSYRFTQQYWKDIERNNFKQSQVIPIKHYSFHRTHTITSVNAEFEKVLRFYDNITISGDWYNSLNYVCINGINAIDGAKYFQSLNYVKQINTGNITTLTKGVNGRLFHPLICMNSTVRKYVRYNNETLINLDIKACQPNVIKVFAKCPKWAKDCEQDIYTKLSSKNREITKKYFQQAISYYKPGKRMYKAVKQLRDNIKQNYPVVWELLENWWEEISKGGLSPQARLQQIESSIFITLFKETKCLPLHDGFICLKKDFENVKARLDILILEVLGENAFQFEIKELTL